MSTSATLDLVVVDSRALTPAIRQVTLSARDGSALPGWTAGAHVRVMLPTGGDRSYSLIESGLDPAAMAAPTSYRLGVRREEAGQGGSLHMHGLAVGDAVAILPPANHFALAEGDRPVVLVAGGIGVTPLISMAASLRRQGRAFRFVYAARDRAQFAFLDEIERLAGPALTLHADDEAGGPFALAELMASLHDSEPLQLCGPTPMIETGIATAKALGWADGRLRFEIFAAPAPVAGDQPFEVVLNGSGKSFTIPADRSILDVLIEAGEDPIHDCKRGDCGICQVGVIEGVPDHRDVILSDAEKAAGKLMQICVSRSKSPRLVLDL
jgi:vanillate O-demethylase ferredoxin subunit